MYELQLEREAWKSLGRGVYKGTARSLKKWDDFLMRLGHEPGKTLGKIAQDVKAVGMCLGYAAAELSEHSLYAYQADMQLDFIEDAIDLFKNGTFTPRERRVVVRAQRNKAAIESGAAAVLNASLDVISNMAAKSFEDNIADITEFGVDALITAKATEAVMQLAQFTSNVLLQGGREILEVIPTNLLDSPVAYMQTSTGEIIAVAEKTGEDINIVASKQIAINRAVQVEKVEELSHEIQQLTKADKVKIAKLRKSLKPFASSEAVINPERLRATTGIKQIENFRLKTNNFDPKMLEILHPDEKLYLNLCDWLYPQSVEINKELKAMGGLIIRDPNNANIFVKIEEFDLFHSLLGEMQHGSIRKNLTGGHLMIPELKSALCEFNEMQTYWDGFIDVPMKLKRGNAEGFTTKSFFPYGNSPADCTNIIKNAINDLNIKNLTPSKVNFFNVETNA